MFYITSSFSQECISCEGTTTSGVNPSAIGTNTKAEGHSAFAAGFGSEATAFYTTALGFFAKATYTSSIAFGNSVKASAHKSVVIGSGEYNADIYLENQIPRSLMVGFRSKYPTLFVSESPQSGWFDKTGKVGIGNVTMPQAKLHIRSDDGELAALFVEPNNFNEGDVAKIILGDTNHFIKVDNNNGIEFRSESNYIFKGENAGFGVDEPKAKIHIDGDLLFENSFDGLIMKSEDGNCWKGTISNNGELQFTQIDCGTLTSIQNITEPKHSEVFIYPNPTKGEMTIEYTGSKNNLRVEFHTINGLLIATYKITKGDNQIVLNEKPDQMIIASVYTKKGELISTNKVMINR